MVNDMLYIFYIIKKGEYLAGVIFSVLIQSQLFLGRKSGISSTSNLEYKLLEGAELVAQFLVSTPRSLREHR